MSSFSPPIRTTRCSDAGGRCRLNAGRAEEVRVWIATDGTAQEREASGDEGAYGELAPRRGPARAGGAGRRRAALRGPPGSRPGRQRGGARSLARCAAARIPAGSRPGACSLRDPSRPPGDRGGHLPAPLLVPPGGPGPRPPAPREAGVLRDLPPDPAQRPRGHRGGLGAARARPWPRTPPSRPSETTPAPSGASTRTGGSR